MRLRRLLAHVDLADEVGLADEAVVSLHVKRRSRADLDLVPPEEAVDLTGVFAPGTAFDHDVGRPGAELFVERELAEHGCLLAECGVDAEELDEKRALLAGFLAVPGKAVPPPVVALVGKATGEHEAVAGDIVRVACHEHLSLSTGDELLQGVQP